MALVRKNILNKNQNKKYTIPAILALTCVIIINSLNIDQTWTRNTDFSKLTKLYEPVRVNNQIKVIAAYPIQLNFIKYGFTQPYQLIGQIIYNKPLANGASIGSKRAEIYQGLIQDLNNPKTIDYLTKYNIDTILIYNKLLANSNIINNKLIKDDRVEYIGHFTQKYDKGNASTSDYSRDINIYQIKKVVQDNKNLSPLFLTTNKDVNITYEKIDSYRYLIYLHNFKKPTNLVFNSPYTPKWQLFNEDLSKVNSLFFLSNKNSPNNTHKELTQYANAWTVYPSNNECINLTLYFSPYSVVYLGNIISYTALIICLTYLIFIKYEK